MARIIIRKLPCTRLGELRRDRCFYTVVLARAKVFLFEFKRGRLHCRMPSAQENLNFAEICAICCSGPYLKINLDAVRSLCAYTVTYSTAPHRTAPHRNRTVAYRSSRRIFSESLAYLKRTSSVPQAYLEGTATKLARTVL